MKSWKVWVPIAVVLGAVLIGGGVWAFLQIFGAVSAPVQAADRFLGLVGQGKLDEAYRAGAEALRKRMNSAQFAQRVRQLGLTGYESSSFPRVAFKDGDAVLEGAIARRDGDDVPLAMTLTKVGEAWRVASFGKPLPDRAVILEMVRRSLGHFNEAVKTGNFEAFHATLATPFQRQYSAEQLKQAFGTFIDNKIDLSGALALEPVFQPDPAIGARQTMRVTGHFPSRPSRLNFDLSYVPEEGAWKLIAIRVDVRPQDR